MEALKGKKLHELIAAGIGKIQATGAGTHILSNILLIAAPAPAKAEVKADTKKGKEPKKEEKKEEPKEEKKEEEPALAGGFDIFGDEV